MTNTAKSGRRARKSAPPAASLPVIGRAAFIASGEALPTKLVDVPELGGAVRLKKLDAGARLDFQAKLRGNAGAPDAAEQLALNLVRAMLINEDGSPMFEDTSEDMALLRRMDPDAFVRLLSECSRFANIGADVSDAAKN